MVRAQRSGQLDAPDAGLSIHDGANFSFPFPDASAAQSMGSDYAQVTVTPTTASSAKVDISYFPHDELDLADGDYYTVTLSNDTEASLTYEQTVTYTVSYPNGAGCAPLCRSADVTLSDARM